MEVAFISHPAFTTFDEWMQAASFVIYIKKKIDQEILKNHFDLIFGWHNTLEKKIKGPYCYTAGL